MSRFKVGNKVRIIKRQDSEGKVGLKGIIRGVGKDGNDCYQIEFPEGFEGHSCNHLIEDNRGFNVKFNRVELVEEELKNNKMDIEKVKGLSKEVLVKAKKEVLEARAEKQTKEAAIVLTELFDKKDSIEETMGEEQKELNNISKDIKVFDVKK